MTNSSTFSRSATQTTTAAKVRLVTRKVQADLISILELYAYFSEPHAQKLIHDIRVFLSEEVVDVVEFVWKESASNRVLDSLRYNVATGLADGSGDKSGGIRYRSDLASVDFNVRVTYSARWRGMSETSKAEVRAELQLAWGPAGALDYSGGQWRSDRTYSDDGYGLVRSRFVR